MANNYDAAELSDQMVRLGLISSSQMREATEETTDGSADTLLRTLMRKGWLTSWQREKLVKGDFAGFFYGPAKVLFHIAEGTFARVYRGERTDSGEAVAIKVLRRRFTADAAAVARFGQEAEAGMALLHPNIVKIHEFGESEKLHYMIMEYVEGSNLRDFLKIRGRLGADEAMPILLGMARGLRYSHDNGVTHRDIKGTNILISTKREAKLVDFGLANVGDDRVTEFAHTRTVDYSALERGCNSPKGDPRSDIYFLGCVFYQMLTGVLPLPEVETADPLAKMLKRSFGAIKPMTELRYPPPPELCQIIEKMMAFKLDQRYQNMVDVLRDLDKFERKQTGKSSVTEAEVAEEPVTDEDLFAEAFGRQRGTLPAAAEKPASPAKSPDVASHTPTSESPSSSQIPVTPVSISRPVGDSAAVAIPGKRIMVVETQAGIRDALQKALAKMGFEVSVFSAPEPAATEFSQAPVDIVLYDLDGLPAGALETFLAIHQKAHDELHELAAIVVLGPRQEDLIDEFPLDDRLVLLKKPIKIKDVQTALQQVGALVG